MHDLCNNMYHTAGQIQDFRKGEEVLYASGPIPKEGGGGGGGGGAFKLRNRICQRARVL